MNQRLAKRVHGKMYTESGLLNKILQKARKATLGQILFDQHDHRQTVLLAGTGRSGTTWAANIINYANTYRFMFEPFYPQAVDVLSHCRRCRGSNTACTESD